MKQLGSFQSSVLDFDAQVLLKNKMQSILVFHCQYKYKSLP